jgi:hypothetical protein
VSEFAAGRPNRSGDSAAKPTNMYVGGWIVKQKDLLELARNSQIFLTAGALKYRRDWFTSLDFQRRIAVLTLLLQHSQSIGVPRRPHARRKEFLYGTF